MTVYGGKSKLFCPIALAAFAAIIPTAALRSPNHRGLASEPGFLRADGSVPPLGASSRAGSAGALGAQAARLPQLRDGML